PQVGGKRKGSLEGFAIQTSQPRNSTSFSRSLQRQSHCSERELVREIMKIYTKTGDAGDTGLWGGQRVAKDATRVQAYGTVDECNAAVGVARASGVPPELDAILARIQDQLFVVGADLASPSEAATIPRVGPEEIMFLERSIDALEQQLEPLKQF